MADPHVPDPVLLVVAAFSGRAEALAWARERLSGAFGQVAMESAPFAFDQTAYYQPTMGPGLRKQFFVFRDLIAADRLAVVKLQTNRLEQELARGGTFAEQRPLNLDPGVLALGKFVLATSKDQAHRVYLRDGIYAEASLRYQGGAFEPWPWTYADYRQPEVLAFLKEAREFYRERLREIA
jgi:hypothetical protein